jgi:hypothetical protein
MNERVRDLSETNRFLSSAIARRLSGRVAR